MSNTEKLADWFVDQVRNHGLRDVKFFPTTDTSASVDDCAGALLEVLDTEPF